MIWLLWFLLGVVWGVLGTFVATHLRARREAQRLLEAEAERLSAPAPFRIVDEATAELLDVCDTPSEAKLLRAQHRAMGRRAVVYDHGKWRG